MPPSKTRSTLRAGWWTEQAGSSVMRVKEKALEALGEDTVPPAGQLVTRPVSLIHKPHKTAASRVF